MEEKKKLRPARAKWDVVMLRSIWSLGVGLGWTRPRGFTSGFGIAPFQGAGGLAMAPLQLVGGRLKACNSKAQGSALGKMEEKKKVEAGVGEGGTKVDLRSIWPLGAGLGSTRIPGLHPGLWNCTLSG
jgi:hypothetical protein